ncbi:flagellin [Parapedomonas caeni]
MTRVASFSQNQALLSSVLKSQTDLFKAQQQVNTGKKSQDYAGIASDTSTLVSAKALKAQTDSFIKTGTYLNQTLSTLDLQIGAFIDSSRSLRQSVLEVVATGDAQGFQQTLETSFEMLKSTLNTMVGGSYLFSGSRTTTKPFSAETLDDLAALGNVADAFNNDQIKATVRIADTYEMQYGVLADEVAQPLMEVIQRIKQFHDTTPGGLNGQLDDTEKAYLESELAALDSAIQGIQQYQVANGLRQKRVEEIGDLMSNRSAYLEDFVSNIEDVNMAEAITRLQNDQSALEVSYRVIGSLSELNLSKYI